MIYTSENVTSLRGLVNEAKKKQFIFQSLLEMPCIIQQHKKAYISKY